MQDEPLVLELEESEPKVSPPAQKSETFDKPTSPLSTRPIPSARLKSNTLKRKQTTSEFPWGKIVKILALLSVAYFLLFSSYGPGVLVSTPEKVYERCKRKMAQTTSRAPAGMAGDLMKGFQEAMTDGICKAMKEACVKDSKGDICQGALNSL